MYMCYTWKIKKGQRSVEETPEYDHNIIFLFLFFISPSQNPHIKSVEVLFFQIKSAENLQEFWFSKAIRIISRQLHPKCVGSLRLESVIVCELNIRFSQTHITDNIFDSDFGPEVCPPRICYCPSIFIYLIILRSSSHIFPLCSGTALSVVYLTYYSFLLFSLNNISTSLFPSV